MVGTGMKGATRQVQDVERELASLWSQAQLGAAASLLLQAYGPGIAGYLSTMLRKDGLWHDAFSEFAEELWKALPRFRGAGTFRAWAYAIAHRCALRQLRAAKRRRARPLRDSELSRLAEQARTISSSLSRARRATGVEKLRALLSADEQALLTLRIDRGMSWAEVVSVLGGDESAATLRKRYERVTRRLRAAALKQGLLPAGRAARRGQEA
jgi:RNA polymerase sigma-70 factor (ECF subfamily)